MTAEGAQSTFDVAQESDHVEVRGVSSQDVLEALDLLSRVRLLQAGQAVSGRADLVHALMTRNVSLTSPATLAQAQRLASQRDALLASAVLTYETLHELRGDRAVSSTRTWVARARARHVLFTVAHLGRTLIPAFQLDPAGRPRPELEPILAILLQAGIDGWPLWTWLVSPTSLLSGAIPEVVAAAEPARALRAAARFASPTAA
jgi:hypothetical protein